MRWSEEILLLREEMRRTLSFLEWHAEWWEGRAKLHSGLPREAEEGMVAYAQKQAHIRRAIRTEFNTLWRGSNELINMGVGSDNEILNLKLATTTNLLDPPSLRTE